MESWCELVSSHPGHPDPVYFSKALRTADILLSNDLAPFEIDWLVQTFLFEPIDVLNTILSQRKNDNWFKNISDAFKVISKIVNKYWDVVKNENGKIVQLCSLSYDANTKKDAVNCLINVLKNPDVDIGNGAIYVDALETATTCKAPLALLVGTICRYYPESISEDYDRIWKIYLKMLEPKKTTDTLVSAVLQSIEGLFDNFGYDLLQLHELNAFYNNTLTKCAKISKCVEPLLSILKSHGGLFKERVAEDRVLRLNLWRVNIISVKDAILSIYAVIFEDKTQQQIKDIIKSEIQAHLTSESSLMSHTALRVVINAKVKHGVVTEGVKRPDDLEFHLKNRSISYHETELLSIYLQTSESYVKALMCKSIMYYEHIPSSLRKDIVVNGIVKATDDNRKIALITLVNLSLQRDCLEKYSDLWRSLLSHEKGMKIFDEVVKHLISLLKSTMDVKEKDPEYILSLSGLTSYILCLSKVENNKYSGIIKSMFMEIASCMNISPSSLLTPMLFCTEMFDNESILYELRSMFEDDDPLAAIRSILCQENAEPKLLINAVSRLDYLIKTEKNIEQLHILNLLKPILKLRNKKDNSSCDNRILKRNISMFLGEHSNMMIKENVVGDIHTLELNNKIIINLPNVTEGTIYKVDLLRIMQISLDCEDFENVYCFLNILSASLRVGRNPGLQLMLCRCIHVLCKAHILLDVYNVLHMCADCDFVSYIIQSITNEMDHEIRRMLCDNLQCILELGVENTEELLTLVAEEIVQLFNSNEKTKFDSGIDLAKIFVKVLHQNDTFTLKYLSKIILASIKNINNELFKLSTDLFIIKCDIFNENNIKEIIIEIVNYMKNNYSINFHVVLILEFLKRIFDLRKYQNDLLVDELNLELPASEGNILVYGNTLQILALSKSTFNFDTNTINNIIINYENTIINVMDDLMKDFSVDNHRNMLMFFKEYAIELRGNIEKETLQHISKLIESTPLHLAIQLKKDYSECLSNYKNHIIIPNEIRDSMTILYNKININDINKELNSNFPGITLSNGQNVEILKMISEFIEIPCSELWTNLLSERDYSKDLMIDWLTISEKGLSSIYFESLLREKSTFVRKYLSVYIQRILESNFELDKYFLVDFAVLYSDQYRKYENDFDKVLEIVEKAWPSFQDEDFEAKLKIASTLLRLPRAVGLVTPVRWVMNTITDDGTSDENKLRLITLLPGGDEYSGCYRHIAGKLPTRLSEMTADHAAGLRALLDSLASTGDLTLLDIIITLAAADDTKGWWEDAMVECMSILAERRDEDIFLRSYKTCMRRPGLGSCRRIFVPLLKYSSKTFCEEFSSKIIVELLETFKTGFKEPSDTELYRSRVLSYAKAFIILQAIIDKLPVKNLESGIINTSCGTQRMWYVVETVCKYSVTLRDSVRCPDDASEETRSACLGLQCAAYNCLVSAICKRSPPKKLYTHLYNTKAWSKIVDPRVVIELRPRGYWDHRSKKGHSEGEGKALVPGTSSSSFTGTTRTRLFMTTLTENPLLYDMIPLNDDDDKETQEEPVIYDSHPLNCNGCLSSVTSLVEHSSKLEHFEFANDLASGLNSDIPVNAKWLLAQAICNTELLLKPHASTLAPALLALVATTRISIDDKQTLNNLHIDILWVIINWEIKELSNYDNMNVIVSYLINTCIEYRKFDNVYRRLLNTLNKILEVFGKSISLKWSSLQKYCDELPNSATYLLPILQRILKNGLPLPQLLPVLFTKFDTTYWYKNTKLPEVFGLAVSLEDNKYEYLVKFNQLLINIRNTSVSGFVRVLLQAQRTCPKCCDSQIFRKIVDLAPKAEHAKCLNIISIYLDSMDEDDGTCGDLFETIALKELVHGDYMVEAMKVAHSGLKFMSVDMRQEIVTSIEQHCKHSSVAVRKQACNVILKVFKDLVLNKDENKAKRPALSGTPILNMMGKATPYHQIVMENICRSMFDKDGEIATNMRNEIEKCLSKEMSKRFAELFYIIFNFAKTDGIHNMSEYSSVFLELLFKSMMEHEGFRSNKLSDHTPAVSANSNIMLTDSKAATVGRSSDICQSREVNEQMGIAKIVEVFLQSSKNNSQICKQLCIQMMRVLQGTGRRFDFDATMAELLADMLKKDLNYLTPLVLEASRIFLNNMILIEGLEDSVCSLKKNILCTDISNYCNILYEDIILRKKGRGYFDFRLEYDWDVDMPEEKTFSVENLTKVFGELSNWDDKTVQEKARIQRSLPPLLAEMVTFETSLKEYFDVLQTNLDYNSWFNKMVACYYSCNGETVLVYKDNWLNEEAFCTTRDFTTASVIEAMKWGAVEDSDISDVHSICTIKSDDCLAEWAARLMIRSSFHSSGDDETKSSLCLSDELKYCIEANRREMPDIALQCIERNKFNLEEDTKMQWFCEKVRAEMSIAIRDNNIDMLQKALQVAETHDMNDNMLLKQVILELRVQLKDCSITEMDDILESVNSNFVNKKYTLMSTEKDVLVSIYDIAMNYYYDYNKQDLDSDHDYDINTIVSKMLNIINIQIKYNIITNNNNNLLFSIVLSELKHFDGVLENDTAKRFLEMIVSVLPNLDTYTINFLNSILNTFPKTVWNEYKSIIFKEESLDVCKEYFKLISDPRFVLLGYCKKLLSTKDTEKWKEVFENMKKTLFECVYGGTDYITLNTFKNKLNSVEYCDMEEKLKIVQTIFDEIKIQPLRSTLKLSQLSPKLACSLTIGDQQANLGKLLALPQGVNVVKFNEQVIVYGDAKNRPCLISVLLSNGHIKKYIVKTGEPMSYDASVQRSMAAMGSVLKRGVATYDVTTLSEESAIIEYLEDYQRLRKVMGDKVNVPVPDHRITDDKLVLSPTAALDQYKYMCNNVPVYTLRESIEGMCTSFEEFIHKRRIYTESLAVMTITNWLFGVGDRHLENIMLSTKDCTLCGIDWSSVFQYGVREFVPARLTPNILAVCDVKVLESKLQDILIKLRKNKNKIESFLEISFYWKDFKELEYIKNILNGDHVSYEITLKVLRDSLNVRNRNESINIVKAVFETFQQKQTYSVEDQIRVLLHQCTNPGMLSVIPQGFEAWV